jgi:hypothetical protein
VYRGRILKNSQRSVIPPFIGEQTDRQATSKAILLSAVVIAPLPLPVLNSFCTFSFLFFLFTQLHSVISLFLFSFA